MRFTLRLQKAKKKKKAKKKRKKKKTEGYKIFLTFIYSFKIFPFFLSFLFLNLQLTVISRIYLPFNLAATNPKQRSGKELGDTSWKKKEKKKKAEKAEKEKRERKTNKWHEMLFKKFGQRVTRYLYQLAFARARLRITL